MDLRSIQLEGPGIAGAYASGDPGALRFFHRWCGDADAFPAKGRELDGRFDRAARVRAASAFRMSDTAHPSRIEDWIARSGWIVATGQQPGLFGGALLTLYKAATAISTARLLEERFGRPVLPMFWIASEDHDWAEVDHLDLPDVDNELTTIRLGAEPEVPEGAIGRRVVHEGAVSLALADLAAALPPSDFRDDWVDRVGTAYAHPGTLADGFERLLLDWLGPEGLVVVDARDPVVKQGSIEVLTAALDRNTHHHDLLIERARELDEAGWDVQVPILEGALNLFVDTPLGRQRVIRGADGALRLRETDTPISRAELETRIQDAREGSVSPNALLRPLVESRVFPVIAAILGPSELAYHAQLPPLFSELGLEPPVIVPRASFVAVEGKIDKVLGKLGLPIEELARPPHELESALAREAVPPAMSEALSALRDSLARGLDALDAASGEVDPTLSGPISSARSSAQGAIDDVERKILQAVKRREAIALEQLAKARLHLRPRGRPQERVVSPLYFLARYDRAFLADVVSATRGYVGRTLPSPDPSGGDPSTESGMHGDGRAEATARTVDSAAGPLPAHETHG